MKTRSRKTRLLSFVLSLLMVLTLMPDISVRVYATGDTNSGMYEVGAEVTDYLTFTAVSETAKIFMFRVGGTLQYKKSTDGSWTDYSNSAINLTTGQSVSFRGTDLEFSNTYHIDITGTVSCSGDVCSLRLKSLDPDDTENYSKFAGLEELCFHHMFDGCAGLTSAPTLKAATLQKGCYSNMFKSCTGLTAAPALPATTLAKTCYESMFNGCTNLTTAPELPATALAQGCYRYMFESCKSLTTAPALPATTLTYGCYYRMFSNCEKLTVAPVLPATTLTDACYQEMFKGCKSLTTAPALPATSLAYECYQEMFSGCTGLTTAPALPATSLTSHCYDSMFNGCTGLTTAPALPATTLANYCYRNMFNGCTGIRLSETKNDEYKYTYTVGQTTATYAFTNMFYGTGGTFKGTPDVGKTYYMDSSIHRFNGTITGTDLSGEWQYAFPDLDGKYNNITKIEVLMDIESVADGGWGIVAMSDADASDDRPMTYFTNSDNKYNIGIKKFTVEKDNFDKTVTWAGVQLIGKGTLLAYTITFDDNSTVSAGSWSYPTYTAPTAVTGLSYTGTAQELVTADTVTGGTIKYLLGKVISLGNNTVLSIENMNVNDIYQPTDDKGIIFPKDYTLTIAETTYLPVTDTEWHLDNQIKLSFEDEKCWIGSRSEINSGKSVSLPDNIDALRITAIDTVNKTITAEAVNTSQLWSETVPTETAAGTYPVYYRIDASAGYHGVAATKIADVTISKGTLTISAEAKDNIVYDGEPLDASDFTFTGKDASLATKATVTVTKAGEPVYSDFLGAGFYMNNGNYYSPGEFKEYGYPLANDDSVVVIPDNTAGGYEVKISERLKKIKNESGTFVNGHFLISNDGTLSYTKGDGNAETTWETTLTTVTLEAGKSWYCEYNANTGKYYIVQKIPAAIINAGAHTATITITAPNENFENKVLTDVAVTVGAAANSWATAPVLADNQLYTGSELSLIKTPGTPIFGAATAVTYAVTTTNTAPAAESDAWTAYNELKASALGTYYLWYQIAAGDNWYAAAPAAVGTVTITEKTDQTWTIEMPDYVYDGTAHEPTINGTAYGDLTYTYLTSAGVMLSEAPTEPGDYLIWVSAAGDDTHPSKLESAYYTIKSAKFAAGNTVSFKEKVEFNFLVEATDAETVEGAYVVFTYDHYGEKVTVKKPINKDDKNGKYYRVRLPLTASEMAIDIKAELYLPTLDKPVDTKTRSIKDYAEVAIKSNLDGAEVLKAMLNYGGYTQTALNNNTTLLANSGEGIAIDVSAISPKSETPFIRPTVTEGAKVTYKGSTVITTSDVFVRHYFTVDSSLTTAELSAVKIKVGDKVLALKDLPKNNTGYYYDVAPQLAYELDRENGSVVVYGFAGAETADSENAISIESYNVIDYCEAVANSDKQTTAAKNMVKALYSYYKAAKAYVDSRA